MRCLKLDGTYVAHPRLHPPDKHGRGGAHHHLMAGGHICSADEARSAEQAVKIGRCWAEGWSEYNRRADSLVRNAISRENHRSP
ncbi:MAG: hypothetical protein R3B91_16035 [Planctomycetaceae bacterium]